jgi:hypothetical protein
MENGEVAHRVMDLDSIARRSEVVPRISEELKGWLIKHLDDRLTARQVFEEHKKVWDECWTKNKKHSKGIIYFVSMYDTMSIKRRKKMVHAYKCIGVYQYVEIRKL